MIKSKIQRHVVKLVAAVILAGGLLDGGCVGPGNTGELKIGVLLPASGENLAASQRALKGAEVARDLLNNTGGSDGRKVTLDVVRFRNAKGAVKGFDDLADRNVAAIIGGYSSEDVQGMKSAANRRKILLLLPLASADELTERTDYVVRNCYNDSRQSMALAYYAFFPQKKRRMGILVNLDENAIFARDIAYKTAQSFSDYGGKVAARAGFRENDASSRGALRKLLSADMDVLLLPAYPKAAARIVGEARQMGYTGMIIAPDSVSEQEFLNELPKNAGEIYFASPYSLEYTNTNTRFFRRMMQVNGVAEPGDGEAQGFDAVNLIAAAASRDGAVSKNIRTLNHHAGASGPLVMCGDGNADHMVFINRVEYENGKAKPSLTLGVDPAMLRLEKIDKQK